MNIQLLKQLGNMGQLAGIREAILQRGFAGGVHIAEVYNAAGLRFTVVPDRCMDIFDLSYKGVNISFQSKNGLKAPQFSLPLEAEFAEQWPAGMLVTCGLGNVGGGCVEDGVFPIHGRIGAVPATTFGTDTCWEGEEYFLRLQGEMHQTRMYGRHLSLKRRIETTLQGKTVKLHDVIRNETEADEPLQLLYHLNFGYPLLQADSRAVTGKAKVRPLNGASNDPQHMSAPIDGAGEELYLYSDFGPEARAVLYNERLELGAYVVYDTQNLPTMQQWKRMQSHEYVTAFEPCNTWALNRREAREAGKLTVLPGYTEIETELTIGILDGLGEIREFVRNL